MRKETLKMSNNLVLLRSVCTGTYSSKAKSTIFMLKTPSVFNCQTEHDDQGASFLGHWKSGSKNLMLKFGLTGKWKMLSKT